MFSNVFTTIILAMEKLFTAWHRTFLSDAVMNVHLVNLESSFVEERFTARDTNLVEFFFMIFGDVIFKIVFEGKFFVAVIMSTSKPFSTVLQFMLVKSRNCF
jgi:uncharacterized membrane protein YidH (DUF202 family)